METISSMKNPKVAAWRSLKDKKGRDSQQAFLVEGTRMVRESLASSFTVSAVLLREDFVPDFPLPENVRTFMLPEHVFQSVCDTKTPQGVAAVLSIQTREARGPRLLALDGVQDPGNVGTIVRTADAAGFDGVLFSPDCADLFSPKVLRSTMGSVFRLGFSFPASLVYHLIVHAGVLRGIGGEILHEPGDNTGHPVPVFAAGQDLRQVGQGNGEPSDGPQPEAAA